MAARSPSIRLKAKAQRSVSRYPITSRASAPLPRNLHKTEILLVEDNPGDARLAIEALKDGHIANHLTVVEDGTSALQFLRGEGKYGKAKRPDLVLLDLNLPGKDGREVLREMKA